MRDCGNKIFDSQIDSQLTAKGAPSVEKQSGEAWEVWQKANLDELLDGMSRMEFMLRFTLTHPDIAHYYNFELSTQNT